MIHQTGFDFYNLQFRQRYNIIEAHKQIMRKAENRQLSQCRRALVYGNGGVFSHSAVAILGDGRCWADVYYRSPHVSDSDADIHDAIGSESGSGSAEGFSKL